MVRPRGEYGYPFRTSKADTSTRTIRTLSIPLKPTPLASRSYQAPRPEVTSSTISSLASA